MLGNAPLPLATLLVAGRRPIDLLRALLKKIEPSLLLPPLDVCLEVHLAIHAPLRRVTARFGLAAVVIRIIWVRRTMTVLVPSIPWTLTGMTLSSLSWPSSGTSTAWRSRRVYHHSCIDLWVDVGDLFGIPLAHLSLAVVASGQH